MVVLSPGVAGNPSQLRLAKFRGVRLRSVTQLADADDRACGRQEVERVVADIGTPVGEVVHFAGEARSDPAMVDKRVGIGQSRRDAR